MSIAILGAGIAGLTAAIALRQRGQHVVVYERHASPTTLGAGVVLWPNSNFVLRELGLLSRVAELSGSPQEMRRVSSHGDNLGSISIRAINEHMGFPSYSILRTDLHSVLTDEVAKLGVDVRYDHAIVSIESNDGASTQVTFSNGSRIGPQIVVGADGRMNSVARHYVHRENTPVYQGFVNWVAALDADSQLVDDTRILDAWGVDERFGIVPITRTKVYWAGATAQYTMGSSNEPVKKRDLTDRFSGWPDPIPAIIQATPEASINRIYVHDHDPIHRWHRNNVILIGDAAHAALPTSGQGACQAIEDGWHLTNCLERSPDDLEIAFAEFTQLRMAKTSRITNAARQFAESLFNTDVDYCRARNRRSATTDFESVARGMAHGWSEGLPLRNRT